MSTTELEYKIAEWISRNPPAQSDTPMSYSARMVEAFLDEQRKEILGRGIHNFLDGRK